jgi:hypothetical protein
MLSFLISLLSGDFMCSLFQSVRTRIIYLPRKVCNCFRCRPLLTTTMLRLQLPNVVFTDFCGDLVLLLRWMLPCHTPTTEN